MSCHYHIILYSEPGYGTCAICLIPCACDACASMLEKTWNTGFPPRQQLCYQQVQGFTYWPVLGSFNNWNSIKMSHKSTKSGAFEGIHQVVLDGISFFFVVGSIW